MGDEIVRLPHGSWARCDGDFEGIPTLLFGLCTNVALTALLAREEASQLPEAPQFLPYEDTDEDRTS